MTTSWPMITSPDGDVVTTTLLPISTKSANSRSTQMHKALSAQRSEPRGVGRMAAVQGTIGLPADKLVPRGLGTAEIESFSGYAARVSARIAVPAPQFVRRVFQDADGGGALPLRSTIVAAARRLNFGERGSPVVAAVERLTGHPKLDRLSYFAFLDLFGATEQGSFAVHRRWCPACWRDDGGEPYERKVWWLALVDLCRVHGCLLESRCSVCGRFQPTLPRAVRIHVCSFRRKPSSAWGTSPTPTPGTTAGCGSTSPGAHAPAPPPQRPSGPPD